MVYVEWACVMQVHLTRVCCRSVCIYLERLPYIVNTDQHWPSFFEMMIWSATKLIFSSSVYWQQSLFIQIIEMWFLIHNTHCSSSRCAAATPNWINGSASNFVTWTERSLVNNRTHEYSNCVHTTHKPALIESTENGYDSDKLKERAFSLCPMFRTHDRNGMDINDNRQSDTLKPQKKSISTFRMISLVFVKSSDEQIKQRESWSISHARSSHQCELSLFVLVDSNDYDLHMDAPV